MVHLRSLTLRRFRDLDPGTTMHFSPGFNVLLGRNGSGKSTLLDLICAAAALDFSRYEGESLDLSVELEVHDGLPPRTWAVELSVDAGPPGYARPDWPGRPEPVGWRIDVELRAPARPPISMTLTHEGWRLRQEGQGEQQVGWPRRAPGPYRVSEPVVMALMASGERSDMDRRLFPIGLDMRRPLRVEEGLETFHLLTQPSDDPDKSLFLITGLPQIMVFSPRFAPPDALVSLLMDSVRREADHLVLPESDPWLRALVEGLDLGEARLTIHLDQAFTPQIPDNPLRQPEQRLFSHLSFRFTRPDGSIIQHRHLSYGQKRMLAILLVLDGARGVFVADELVNGLHHAWVDALVARMSGKQCFLTSQNPLLLDHLEFEGPEDVARSFIACEAHTGEDKRRRWSWRSFNAEESEAVFGAFATGLQHVGEILRTRDLC